MSSVWKWVVGSIVGIGFELIGMALNVFEGLQGFFCWIMTAFLDVVQEALIEGLLLFPQASFFRLDDVTKFAEIVTGVNELIPIFALGQIGLIYVVFLCVWVPIRAVLRLVWV